MVVVRGRRRRSLEKKKSEEGRASILGKERLESLLLLLLMYVVERVEKDISDSTAPAGRADTKLKTRENKQKGKSYLRGCLSPGVVSDRQQCGW